MDYSNRFADSLAEDFNPGVEVRDVVKEDMILVQFSSDAPNASLRYWTTIDEANGISTIEEYMDKMALSKEWGNRNVVKVARVKKGTEVTQLLESRRRNACRKKVCGIRDTMKFWEPPHEHEELLEEQIESIIQEVQRNMNENTVQIVFE